MDLEKVDHPTRRHPEFRYKTEFQSHEPEVFFFLVVTEMQSYSPHVIFFIFIFFLSVCLP